MAYVMRYADSPREEVTRFETIDAATAAFIKRAGDLARFGQSVEASLHFLRYNGAWEEYPDYLLSIGPRGGVKRVRA